MCLCVLRLSVYYKVCLF